MPVKAPCATSAASIITETATQSTVSGAGKWGTWQRIVGASYDLPNKPHPTHLRHASGAISQGTAHGLMNGNNNNNAKARAFVIGAGEDRQDPNIVTGTFLLNNCYASVFFDTGADRSFISVEFSKLLDITPALLEAKYTIELADGKLIETNHILEGCILELSGHKLHIDLMPVTLGTFDIVVCMHWLSKN